MRSTLCGAVRVLLHLRCLVDELELKDMKNDLIDSLEEGELGGGAGWAGMGGATGTWKRLGTISLEQTGHQDVSRSMLI